MLEKCLGAHRTRKLRRAVRNGKLTILCLVLTVIVLRGTIGAGKFGTPEQDLLEIRDHFHHHRRHSRDQQHDPLRTTSSSNDNNYNAFDLNNLLRDDDDDDKKPDPDKTDEPYSLGPRVSDWDERRREMLAQSPNSSNSLNPLNNNGNRPRVLMVTGSSPRPCENPIGDHYLLKSIKNKVDYCRIHGIEIFYNMAVLDAEMGGFWSKLPVIRSLLLSRPEVEFLWWVDSDAMFTDMAFEVPWERYRDHNLVMHGWSEMVYGQKNWIGLNTGSFLIRNCQWSLDMLDAWAPMGPRGKVRAEAGKVLSRELKGRPEFEADDQSAMVFLLARQREKWGERVYLESEYYLHGFWEILVDKLEESRPLVTHFVGCKPCGSVGDYPVERCLKGMDRAFNFGDNQVLALLGFRHKSLGSRSVERAFISRKTK